MSYKVSVIIPTYKFENAGYLMEAIRSIEGQTFQNTEVVVVVDNNFELYDYLTKALPKEFQISIKVVLNDGKRGLAASRNVGIINASGDIICFMDDDAIADKRWIEELIRTYEQYPEAIGVGGPILPLGDIPWWLPEEFYWLIGVTPKILHHESFTKVRNTFGSNMSFKREIFNQCLFNESLGIRSAELLQAEEVEFCVRCSKIFKRGIYYNPSAIVYHRILPHRLKMKYLLKRAFQQGYSKAILSSMHEDPNILDVEKDYLREVFKRTLSQLTSFEGVTHSVIRSLLTLSVGLGFIYGKLKLWKK